MFHAPPVTCDWRKLLPGTQHLLLGTVWLDPFSCSGSVILHSSFRLWCVTFLYHLYVLPHVLPFRHRFSQWQFQAPSPPPIGSIGGIFGTRWGSFCATRALVGRYSQASVLSAATRRQWDNKPGAPPSESFEAVVREGRWYLWHGACTAEGRINSSLLVER